MAGVDGDRVGQLAEPAERVEEPLGALTRGDGEVRPGGVADEERVAGQHEPPRHEEGAVLGPVARRVQDADRDRADPELLPVGERLEGELRLGERVHRDREPVLERESAVPGDVVRVRVRLEHAHDPHACFGRRLEVRLDRVGRVDDDRDPRLLVADEIGGATQVPVHELPEEHVRRTLTAGLSEPPALQPVYRSLRGTSTVFT